MNTTKLNANCECKHALFFWERSATVFIGYLNVCEHFIPPLHPSCFQPSFHPPLESHLIKFMKHQHYARSSVAPMTSLTFTTYNAVSDNAS